MIEHPFQSLLKFATKRQVLIYFPLCGAVEYYSLLNSKHVEYTILSGLSGSRPEVVMINTGLSHESVWRSLTETFFVWLNKRQGRKLVSVYSDGNTRIDTSNSFSPEDLIAAFKDIIALRLENT